MYYYIVQAAVVCLSCSCVSTATTLACVGRIAFTYTLYAATTVRTTTTTKHDPHMLHSYVCSHVARVCTCAQAVCHNSCGTSCSSTATVLVLCVLTRSTCYCVYDVM
jgi:uncharacterized protein (DUF885 family)